MEWYSMLLQNKELIKILYGIVISFICLIIVLKSNRFFKLSSHQGIRYFRNAFFFYGLAFLSRYIVGSFENSYTFGIIFFEFFIIIAGFFLLNSLLWKRFYYIERRYSSSLFSPITLIFYTMALVLVLVDSIWRAYFLMFISQVIVFLFASIISYNNYIEKPGKVFPKFYFAAMLLSLAAWILNAFAGIVLNWDKGILFGAYALNTIVFLLFLFGIIKVTKQ